MCIRDRLVVDEFASQLVKRIFKEFLSGKSMYKISEGLNRDGIDTPGVYIAMQVGSEKQLARYRAASYTHLRKHFYL